MHRVYILTILTALMTTFSVWAQDSSARQKSPCLVVPIFHCVQHLEDGSAIGHFGYDLQCPDDAPAAAEVYIDINENNLFSPGSKDRGQPKVFLSGKHIDEFEVDFTMAEEEGGSLIHWSVLEQAAMVDFSKTKDESLDCSTLSQ